jgi:hypothetical protein
MVTPRPASWEVRPDRLPVDEAQLLDGSALDVLGVVALVLADYLVDDVAAVVVTMAIYRRLTDRGLICRQVDPGRRPGE